MWRFIVEPLQVGYMRRALLEVVLLGALGGVVGVYVLLRRLAFLTEVIQLTVFPGFAIAFAFGQSLLLGALVAGTASVVLVTIGARHRRLDPDALMAVLVATFFALGVVVVSRRRGFQSDLTALLFGRILSVDQRQLIDTVVVALICVVALAVLHKELVMRAFDPEATRAMGYALTRLDLVLNLVITLAVVVSVRAVGTVLVVAFVVTPAAAARLVARRIGGMLAVAVGFATIGGSFGLAISYNGSVHHGWRLASGATVVMVFTVGFGLVAGVRALSRIRGRSVVDRVGARTAAVSS
jgi:manganese/iron transport system permease protein